MLLANLTTVGQVAVTYHASIEQLLVLLPPYVASLQSIGPMNNPTGMAKGDFTVGIGDPPACTVGFLPPSQWRSAADLSDIDTPTAVLQAAAGFTDRVRGARNYPCQGQPGKRAPTVEICEWRTVRAVGHAPACDRPVPVRSQPGVARVSRPTTGSR